MQTHARVVVIGGGAIGTSILYHLAKYGWKDVVLVEKHELTSGSTWMAAGNCSFFHSNYYCTRVNMKSIEIYQGLEAETGQATGWHQCGAIRLAMTDDEVDWFHYVKGVLDYAGAEAHLIGPNEIKELHPLLDVNGVKLGFYTPNDGHTDPASSTVPRSLSTPSHASKSTSPIDGVKNSRKAISPRMTSRSTGLGR